MADPQLLTHRTDPHNAAAMVFIHGFGGTPAATWQEFPRYLAESPGMAGWDVYSFGYPTSLLMPDISGLWKARPDLTTLADELATRATVAPLNRYKALAFIAHSMGGLLVQRALVSHAALAGRTSHVLLFGTPSFGLAKARFGFWNRQAGDMVVGSPFITEVRTAWKAQFDRPGGRNGHFRFLAVAGSQDEFVPRASCIDGLPPPGFAVSQQAVVPGDHLQIVKPESADSLSVRLAAEFFRSGKAGADSAFAAAELAASSQTVAQLTAAVGQLDEKALVRLALAHDVLGDLDGAIAVLEQQPPRSTDGIGVLAGRLKRRWLLQRDAADAVEALRLYQSAGEQAQAAGRHDQVFYHAINVAFLTWAFKDDRPAAAMAARQAVDACALAAVDKWRLATEGEAAIILGDDARAEQAYQAALQLAPTPRERDSMFKQASFELDLAENIQLAQRLQALFAGAGAGV